MYSCHEQVKAFHDARITLTEDMKNVMRGRRSANQERLARGLQAAGGPEPLRHVKQGSYAMHTMVQSEVDGSDIDDGAVFDKGALMGPRNGEYSALDAKKMVRNALDDGSFNRSPEVHTNCVRIFYNDGFTIDVPVYREVEEDGKESYCELASSTWKRSDPEAVTEWFNAAVIDKSPDATNSRQMRRIVKLLKAWSKSRGNWNMPSGFILSALTDEAYYKDAALLNRDDAALLRTMESIASRLRASLVVPHPVLTAENITKTDSDANMVELRDRLDGAIDELGVLRSADCTELKALKALKSVFGTDYFDTRIAEIEKSAKGDGSNGGGGSFIAGKESQPVVPVVKRGGDGKYA